MEFKDYVESKKATLKSYQDEGFTEDQIHVPLRDILGNLNVIIDRYKAQYIDKIDKWVTVAIFMENSLAGKSQKKDKKKDFLYERVRVFLRKDPSNISALKYKVKPLPPKEKHIRYAEILSEIALDCIEICVEEFKKDAITMQKLQSNLSERVPDKIEKEYNICPNQSTPIKLARLKRLKEANEEWQWPPDLENEENKDKENKEHHSVNQSKSTNSDKKYKYIRFRFFDKGDNVTPENGVEKVESLNENGDAESLDGDSSLVPQT